MTFDQLIEDEKKKLGNLNNADKDMTKDEDDKEVDEECGCKDKKECKCGAKKKKSSDKDMTKDEDDKEVDEEK